MTDKGAIGHKAAKMMARSKAIETRRAAQLDAKNKLLKNLEDAEKLKLFPQVFIAVPWWSWMTSASAMERKPSVKASACALRQANMSPCTSGMAAANLACSNLSTAK